jgi:hypothetical protein
MVPAIEPWGRGKRHIPVQKFPEIRIIYVEPRHREAFERTQKFGALDETPATLILTTAQEPADQTIGSLEESG